MHYSIGTAVLLFPSVMTTFMAGLHYGNYCSKLVHFEAQKIFSMLKKALAWSDFRPSVNTTLPGLPATSQ